jgi:uncharacterized protein YndB with AHSA1/START domain
MNAAASLKVVAQGDREIVISREFDAPRDMVWDAHTKPELLKRWLGVWKDWALDVCEVDLRVGGRYRWVWRSAKGQTMAAGGVYREVVRPERYVATEQFDDPWYEGEAVSTTVFTDLGGGRTLMTNTMRYASRAARDGVLKSGMETGLVASYDQLAAVLGGGA